MTQEDEEEFLIQEAGKMRSNFENFRPKDDIYILKMVTEIQYLQKSFHDVFQHLEEVEIDPDVDYLDTHLEVGIDYYEHLEKFILSYMVNKE